MTIPKSGMSLTLSAGFSDAARPLLTSGTPMPRCRTAPDRTEPEHEDAGHDYAEHQPGEHAQDLPGERAIVVARAAAHGQPGDHERIAPHSSGLRKRLQIASAAKPAAAVGSERRGALAH
ncbi:MAG TPA: hypothetical protein VF159_00475 [Gemmatimonadaceae bacterium]